MTRRLAIAFAAALAVFLCAPAAAAQAVCGPYDEVSERLSKKYGERVVGRGIEAQGRMLEIWSGLEGWTILMTSADMQSCVMAIGQKGTTWETIKPQPNRPRS